MQHNSSAGTASGWGAEQLTRDELLTLGAKLRRAWPASLRQADRSPGASQMRQSLAVASEICRLWGEVADELIVRAEAKRPTQARCAAGEREPEAG
jgi:hypothetical protein